ncbi:MAG TPA: ComEC/Rec2 family competence protein [Ktedonobacteraceae bacterium]|nr:ComEC/Rec2 family competence protein [Ktedonobacteraceae bacterium]
MTPLSMDWPPQNGYSGSESLLADLHGLTLVVAASACLIGMLLAFLIPLPEVSLLIGIVPALIGVPLLWNDNRGRITLLIVLSLLIGAWRYTIASPINDPQAIFAFVGRGKVEVQGSVTDEPTIQGRSRVLLVAVTSISLDTGASWQDAHGELEVRTLDSTGAVEDPYGANYGDAVELQGVLQPRDQYTAAGVFANMSFPRISVMSSGGNPILAALYHLRVMLATVIAQSLPQPEASVLIAILLSLRTPTLKPLTNIFNETGTAHLIAPSGFKVTLVAGIIMSSTRWLYKKPGVPAGQTWQMLPAERRQGAVRRWLVTALVVTGIIIYTILSGAGPAAIRAGIMGVIVVIAPRIGRIYNVYTALAFAALIMCLIDPFILWDVGFQLSCLGTIGIVRLTFLFQRLLSPLERGPFGHTQVEIIAVTLAAQISTLPIVAHTFNIISFIALLTNILTVPLLGILLALGLLLSMLGLLYAPLGLLLGWVAWPFVLYVTNIVTWCAHVPWAYLTTNNNVINNGLVWSYYGLLALIISTIHYRWSEWSHQVITQSHTSLSSKRALRIVQISAVLVVILATGATALATRANGQLTITFLSVGPTGQPPQGEAILIQTPDGKTALIDGGLDTVSLDQELDSQLPFWQRSLDLVLLTTPRSDHLIGSQDIVSRYQIGEVADAGMLHPNTGYALWRRTIAERNIRYLQLRQGMTIALGTQMAIQVFWPASPLHKSSDEERDNGLIVRLLTPNFSLLLLGVTAASNYVLEGLLASIAPVYLQADIVQVVGQTDKNFSSLLLPVLQAAHAKLLIITPASLSAKQRKAGATSVIAVPPELSAAVTQVVQTAQVGTVELYDSNNGWSITSV